MRTSRLAEFPHLAVAAVAALASGCQATGPATARPAEVPIGEFHADAPPKSTPEDDKSSGSSPTSSASAKNEDGGSLGGTGAAEGKESLATKLDDKNAFAGATFGNGPRAFRGLKQAEKKGDRTTYHVPAGRSYASAPLNNVDYTFTNGKLGVIAFTVKNSADCKSVRAALERDFGAPQKVVPSPETAVWKGAKVALRYNGGLTCGGMVVSREHGGPDFAGVDN
jgi:hypothetical protein